MSIKRFLERMFSKNNEKHVRTEELWNRCGLDNEKPVYFHDREYSVVSADTIVEVSEGNIMVGIHEEGKNFCMYVDAVDLKQ